MSFRVFLSSELPEHPSQGAQAWAWAPGPLPGLSKEGGWDTVCRREANRLDARNPRLAITL